MVNLRNVAGLSCALIALHTSPTQAEDQAIAGRLQLQTQFSLALLGISAQSDRPLAVNAGLGCCGASAVTPSLLFPSTGIGIGFAIDEHWIPSLSATLSSSQLSNSAKRYTDWSVQPGLSYVFAAGELARPYAGIALVYSRDSTLNGYIVGARVRVGTQLHVAAHFSIDPFLELAYDHGHIDPMNQNFAFARTSLNQVSLRGGFALSAWL